MRHFFSCKLFLYLSLAFCYIFYGCSITEPRPVVLEELDNMDPKALMDRERYIAPPGPPPFSEKLGPVTRGMKRATRLYSLTFKNAPLGEVINAITIDTDSNLSVESGVDLGRPVTVRLTNVTFREALEMVVVKGAGYAWKMEEGCLYIARFEERLYHLDYLDLTGETEIEVGGDMLASSVEDAGVTGKFQVKASRTMKNNDVWSGVQKALEGLKSEDGILQIDRNAGIICMADTPKRIASMVRFLDSLSESLHRQVIIQARILEVSLDDAVTYGIDWSNLEVAFEINSDSWKKKLPDNIDIDFNSGSIVLADESSVSATLDFLQTQGDVTVLSNPHMSVMNGQSAVMTVGYQFPYGDIDGVDRDTDTGLISYGTSIKRAILGLQLGITPQISGNGFVTLHIVPTITRIQRQEQVDIPTASTETQTISNPVIDLQELLTTVRVREGQTVILAGLISQVRNLNHEGLPWLSAVPFLGYLFRHMEEARESRELVILVTPYIKKAM
ncbi:MAG: hypothetical protein SV775_07780 [Thermodesulfobacteriota bacterium]|nr:hypothetical protein [Thermodesulfobacteriota bacterium]